MYWDKQKHVLLCSFAAISVINIPLPSVKSLCLQDFFAELHVPVVMWGIKCTRILHFHFLRRKIESEHRKYMYIFILTCFTCKNLVIPLICILYFSLQKLNADELTTRVHCLTCLLGVWAGLLGQLRKEV